MSSGQGGSYSSNGIGVASGAVAVIAGGGSNVGRSDAITGIGGAKDLSLEVSIAGTTPNVKVEIEVKVRGGSAYVLPDTGAAGLISAGITDTNAHVFALSVPVCSEVKLKFTNLHAANAATPSYVLNWQ